ncbi:hypothetical protein D3C87_1773770 [compost metagenome]
MNFTEVLGPTIPLALVSAKTGRAKPVDFSESVTFGRLLIFSKTEAGAQIAIPFRTNL